jgi:succinyl-CoA synthetase alpha subunit
VLGPNCLGVMRPCHGLNATFGHDLARPGHVALVSQSGAVCTAMLDWSGPRRLGYSAVVSLGAAADVDFGDILDYLALDPQTHSILLYVEGVRDARRFMSGLRAAARLKPVVVVKSGRHPAGSRAASTAHVCRTVCRRAERAIVALSKEDTIHPQPRQYVNRLSDLMFVLARVLNRFAGGSDVLWNHERKRG